MIDYTIYCKIKHLYNVDKLRVNSKKQLDRKKAQKAQKKMCYEYFLIHLKSERCLLYNLFLLFLFVAI